MASIRSGIGENMEEKDKLIKQLADDYSAVLKEAKSMGCNEIKALYNIPLKNMELIVQTLEKQIPKKPEIRNATCADIESELRDFITTQGEICRCPTCKDTICVSGIEYCWYCGQRLDWSEESEE